MEFRDARRNRRRYESRPWFPIEHVDVRKPKLDLLCPSPNRPFGREKSNGVAVARWRADMNLPSASEDRSRACIAEGP